MEPFTRRHSNRHRFTRSERRQYSRLGSFNRRCPGRPAILYAFDANKIDQPIYTSEQNSQRDRAALATRFVIPVVVNGRVYFGARGEVEVYGLLKWR
jgi:hypothetical protein